MTEKKILNIIADLNSQRINSVELSSIFPSVNLGNFSAIQELDSRVFQFGPKRFYLVKNRRKNYIAAVYDMGSELHWVVAKKYRKRRVLVNPLIKVLPHVLASRQQIQALIEKDIGEANFNASCKLALKCGFIEAA